MTFHRAYGFDEIALAPSDITVDESDVNIGVTIAGIELAIPIIASAMDSVCSPSMAVALGKLGATGVLNLEGVHTRYENPESILKKIASVSNNDYVTTMQNAYQKETIKDHLVERCIQTIKSGGGHAIVSSTPQRAAHLGPLAAAAGADAFIIQSTVISKYFYSSDASKKLDIETFCASMPIPVLIGNTANYDATKSLLSTGVSGIFVGIGPGAACTTRGVLGIGVPMATCITDTAKARNDYFEETGNYVSIIADGGIINSGDICKAIACGADAVMIGSPLARAHEAPGLGFHWGMATPNALLPRGARIEVGSIADLKTILLGPSSSDDGSLNLAGALSTGMATLGAKSIAEMHNVKKLIAPSLQTEGKLYQKTQKLGMGKR
ncbi:GuaB3 family IMP dehydrogenase-related protein [bacterium]|jgi:IMP dehydrogenase|nr:GuaB3 family IMP dehydrogenase-related protein [bacterium]|tara:strand:+ start:6458 stop:7603 length:1146 start_codon:yes stop_codon:yes gene_type:complete